jgi:ABC-type multidrug transport system fused ATPase/permease subunit
LNSMLIGLMVFGCTFGASLVASACRNQLPVHHLEGPSKDVVTLVLGLIATLTALVLSLLISSGYSSYQMQKTELRQLSVHLFQIDRALAFIGPEASPQREQLKGFLTETLQRIWPDEGASTYPADATQEQSEELFRGISALEPKTNLQRMAQERAEQLLMGAGETRHLMIAQSQGALSWPILFVLMSWVTILFFGFGLLARLNLTVCAALLVGSLSVAAAIFLIVEMNQPYAGLMHISSGPIREVVAQIGH